MKIYYNEFEDLESLNEYVSGWIMIENIISISYINNMHCIYYWL